MAAVKVSLFVLLLLIVYASAARTARTNLRKSVQSVCDGGDSDNHVIGQGL